MIERIAILGAGNGGKTAAADLTLQGKRVHLFEFPEFHHNLEGLEAHRTLTATGAVCGEALLERVTSSLTEALEGVDTVMVCTQALAHERVARELAPLIRPDHLLILNPGSTCGALHFAHIFRKLGLKTLPTIIETSTLTYGCRAKGATAEVSVKVKRVLYGALPGSAVDRVGPALEALYPGLVRGRSVLEAGLNNANPIIHPPITLLNAARIEKEGAGMRFYGDGVSPTVARMIQKLDEERMGLLRALGYPAQPDPLTCVEQGYAASTDYFECYGKGPGFIAFASPDTLDCRYFHEDIGMGLVMFCSLGEFLGIPTPTCEAFVRMGEVIMGIPYAAEGKRTFKALGLGGLSCGELMTFLETGQMPAS
jgi:opine dehydrogenase